MHANDLLADWSNKVAAALSEDAVTDAPVQQSVATDGCASGHLHSERAGGKHHARPAPIMGDHVDDNVVFVEPDEALMRKVSSKPMVKVTRFWLNF